MTEPKYLIWSNYSLDYEDWREDLEAEYPELSEQEREEKMYERNSEYLDDERMKSVNYALNVSFGLPSEDI